MVLLSFGGLLFLCMIESKQVYTLFAQREILEFALAMMPLEAQHGSGSATSTTSTSRPKRKKRTTRMSMGSSAVSFPSDEDDDDRGNTDLNEDTDIDGSIRDELRRAANERQSRLSMQPRGHLVDQAKADELRTKGRDNSLDVILAKGNILRTGTRVER